ncbi:MAG TPA: hypothetical protein ENK71_01635, partial [Epsilonproteobacteria bacterium]|nr:hypothetical protein [Campylobacterota bacterium]
MKLESKPNESEAEFHVRVQDHLDKVREEAIEKLQGRYQVKEKRLLDRLSTAKARVEKEASDRTGSLIETGIAVLGALLGKPTPTRIGTAVRKGSRV